MAAIIVIEVDDSRTAELIAPIQTFLSTQSEGVKAGYRGFHVALDVIADQVLAIFEDTKYTGGDDA